MVFSLKCLSTVRHTVLSLCDMGKIASYLPKAGGFSFSGTALAKKVNKLPVLVALTGGLALLFHGASI